MQIGVERQLLISAAAQHRSVVSDRPGAQGAFRERTQAIWVALLATVMLVVAGREVMVRQKRRFVGGWGFGVGTLSMFVSSFTVTCWRCSW
jgi:putative ABC transport system permease protein